ncbi:hypothetical protein MCAG_04955 [Micromonospora sp. ATCC 39149]|nr:hypothetical protein MCAG_04955 [Micromonospora sp. ATCC 39149]
MLAVSLDNSAGMLLLGVLLVVAARRAAGPPALAGTARAGAAGLLGGVLGALAGAATARALAGPGAGTPTTFAALVQGMLSSAVVGVVFLAVAYLTDRRDVRPLLAAVRRRLAGAGRRRGRAGKPRQQDVVGPERGDGKETVSG